MAKSYHLKEIIEFEISETAGNSKARPAKNETPARPLTCLPAAQFLDELKLWKRALQIEKSAPGYAA
jgi:hypothetical protein